MKKLTLAYFGSPDFSADFLEKLITDVSINQLIDIKLVVTQPDSPVGRKQIITSNPVSNIAKKAKISILNDLGFPAVAGRVPTGVKNAVSSFLNSIDLALVYAYGELIPKEMLGLPKYGFWNIHPSLLPKYRGPSPIAAPLINGDEKTGITIIKMDEEIDHGPIIAQQSLTIEKNDKRPDLEKKSTDLAFEMFKKTVFIKDSLQLKPQNHSLATYTKKLTKQDGFIEFENLIPPMAGENSPEKLYNLFRGLYPWPGLWTIIKPIQLRQLDEAKRLKITGLNIVRNKNLCSLQIKRVQLEGKKEVDFKTFNEAYKVFGL